MSLAAPGTRTKATKPRDAVTLLSIFLVTLVGIPSRLVVAPLGAAGTPAQLVGLVALLWWLFDRISRPRAAVRAHPVAVAALIFVAAALASYVAANIRPIEAIELRSADRGLLSLCAWMGIFLVAADGVITRERLDTLLRRVVLAGGALASLGLLQFVTGQSFTEYLTIPGLSANSTLVSVIERSGFARPAGTATHPIEFGVVLTSILPIALHYAFEDTGRHRLRRWYPVAAIAVAVPISLSRSALVGALVVLAFMLPCWPKARRRASFVCIGALLVVLYVAVPGMLGTLGRLFTGISSDGSALSRTDSYGLAWQFISRGPVFGRGLSTFLPQYRILDNQYLGVIIEMGFVGLAALLLLFFTGILTARGVRRRTPKTDPSTRHLAQALAAATAVSACSFATFDAFGFPMVPSLLFLILGLVGALWRLTQPPAGPVVEMTTSPGSDPRVAP